MRRRGGLVILMFLLGLGVARLGAAQVPQQSAAEAAATAKGIAFLRGRVGGGQVGEAALMALAFLKADVPETDPAMATLLDRIQRRFNGTAYYPERQGGTDIYEAAITCMVLVNLNAEAHRAEIEAVAQYLMSRQNPNGSWDYNGRSDKGDCSITQYGVLGLWEAENAGVTVPPSVWDRVARFYLSVQSAAGGWSYHRDESQWGDTLSMTAAGVGSLMICQRQLARHRRGSDSINPLLTPLVPEGGTEPYKPATSAAEINEAIKRGIAWMSRNFSWTNSTLVGRTPYYGLYGVERITALADKDTISGVDWFRQGLSFILGTQKADGSWSGDYGSEVNTSYAILFMTKATRKTIERVRAKRLGAGTLLGGRGLPKDLSSLTVAQGRVVVRPMNGAIEGMLAVLEDPRAENADGALAGLIARYHERGSSVLRPYKDRLRKLLSDRDDGVRRVAAWGLGRTGDLEVVPLLIAKLRDPQEDDSVINEARLALQFLSRKVDGYGPPATSTPAQREEAAKKWQAWYDTVRPIGSDAEDDAPIAVNGNL
jgi:hypothetical protein